MYEVTDTTAGDQIYQQYNGPSAAKLVEKFIDSTNTFQVYGMGAGGTAYRWITQTPTEGTDGFSLLHLSGKIATFGESGDTVTNITYGTGNFVPPTTTNDAAIYNGVVRARPDATTGGDAYCMMDGATATDMLCTSSDGTQASIDFYDSGSLDSSLTYDITDNRLELDNEAVCSDPHYFWGAEDMTPDGARCAAETDVTINSGPKVATVVCIDHDASGLEGHVVMPDSWSGGAVSFELEYIQTAADTSALNGDVKAMCRGPGETVNSTWGTEVAMDDAAVTGSNAVDHTTSAAVTPAGTCAAGDTLFWEWQMDATGTTTAVATLNFIGMKMEY
jgi:hypothetical protein